MSARVRPASRDRLHARVDGERERIHHQPASDRRATDAGEHDPVLEPFAAGGRPHGRALRLGDPLRAVGPAGRLEQRNPDVLLLLEAHGHFLADVDLVGVAADDVRREPDRRVLGERHDRDRVRRRERRQPLDGG